jgi:hypothetical protein
MKRVLILAAALLAIEQSAQAQLTGNTVLTGSGLFPPPNLQINYDVSLSGGIYTYSSLLSRLKGQ